MQKVRPNDATEIGVALLGWYDAHARSMPWRTGPADLMRGLRPDPYRVWLSEVMLQQTTVAAVTGYFNRFTTRWPTVADLASAKDEEVMAEWAGLGYYARARNLLKCARAVVADHRGAFPAEPEMLLRLPGIGSYTAAAVASIAFNRPATVVDGNVERVIARLYAVETPLPNAKPALTVLATALTPRVRPGDHAQAMMDLGATICTPKNPGCGMCPLMAYCAAHSQGTAASFPRRREKPEKPTRQGLAYVALREDGALLLERRPDRGLLGGMLGFPGSDWAVFAPDPAPPVSGEWHPLAATVRHTFTHFHLSLAVLVAQVDKGANPERGQFMPMGAFRPSDLPTVMRKVLDVASKEFGLIERNDPQA